MADLTVQAASLGGILPTYAAAAGGGDTFFNDGKTLFHIKNGDASGMIATFDDVQSSSPAEAVAFDPDVDVSVGATSEQLIGPFPTNRFGTSVAVSYDSVTTLTVAAIRVR
jgi:hypothetical protein